MGGIITVGREFGSGGREFGRRLAEELGYEYYDREIISEISKHTLLSEEYVTSVVERRPHTLYPITVGQSFAYAGNYAMSQVQSVYQAQSEIIRRLAEKAPCVIVGRCADYILQDMHPFRIFVYADTASRVARTRERATDAEKALTEKQLVRRINKIDRERAKYYEFYTGLKWGDCRNYDLCVNTSNIEIKDVVPVIAKMFK